MEFSPLISVIVPVYQAESYLEKCLTSIISQTYKNLEIILIDDGSKDKSGQICDIYTQKDKRIKVIHQKNAGVSAARNTGLDIAQGEYICFVDADDYIQPDMLEYLFDLCRKNKTEIAVCCYLKQSLPKITSQIKVLSAREYLSVFYFPSAVWGKLFSKRIINQHRFDKDITIGEDLLFNIQVSLNAGKIAYSPEEKYYYRFNQKGAMYSPFNKKKLSFIKAFSLMKKELSEYPYPEAEKNCRFMEVGFAIGFLVQMLDSNWPYGQEIEQILEVFRKNKRFLLLGKSKLTTKIFILICLINFNFARKIYKMFGKSGKNKKV